MNEPTKEREFDVAIVGAGIAGLMTARQLVAAGRSVIVLDKGRGVGGRMATRRSGPVVFDHGAQYFTARDPDFLRLVNAWEQEGLVRQWARGFATMDGGRKIDETPRWTGVDGMTCIAKDLAADLNLRLQQTVTAVRQQTRGWRVALAEGDSVAAGALLLTPPVPQSLQLLRKGQVQLPHDIRAALERIRYAPCLALLIELAGPSRVPAPGGLWGDGRPIAWLADNSQKGISADRAHTSLTLHAGPEYSAQHWDHGEADVTRELLAAAAHWLGGDVVSTQLHRWRYSLPVATHPDRCLAASVPLPLVFAGDAFGGPRVEGAALSGLAASREVDSLL